eukprot:4206056-Prymnesium_polylepis.1
MEMVRLHAFSPRTAHGSNPRCVYPRQRPRGLESRAHGFPRWLKTERNGVVAGHGLTHTH